MVQMTLKSIPANLITSFVLQQHHHQIQQPEKPQKQMGLTFQSWILHLQPLSSP